MTSRSQHRLSALQVSRAAEPGMYADGGGLYLQVGIDGARSWIFRYQLRGRTRDMGLGSLRAVPLAEARKDAAAARLLKARGIDPIEARRQREAAARIDAAKALTFRQATDGYITENRPQWRNGKHSQQWRNTLDTYAMPTLGTLPVGAVDTDLVLKVVGAIWMEKTTTAERLRGRIEAILGWATARGHRHGDNPARWKGHLQHRLAAREKLRRVRHHPALPYDELPAFMTALQAQPGLAKDAFLLLILTATRTSETITARVGEVDLRRATWTIPAERTKANRSHRIPLSAQALAIVRPLCDGREPADWLFPSRDGKPLSNGALLMLLERMKRGDLTAHGFRSTFRDWAEERTTFGGTVAEMALGHAISDKVEAAYRRGDLFEKRRRLMNAWATFATTQKAGRNVTTIGKERDGEARI